jgi:ADP-dependent NAD(P)H-hydrate dehydratase / NAD(P)H-hydrate epimerase
VSATLPGRAIAGPLTIDPRTGISLPADDPALMSLDLPGLVKHWAAARALPPMAAEAMTGADRKAQRLGVPGGRLMEQAGTAVAAAVRAVAADQGRLDRGPILVLCGPGNNGGDGFVAARHLARLGQSVLVVLVASESKPGTRDASANWDRLAGVSTVTRIHAPTPRDLAIVGQGIEKAGVIVDALLGTGVRGALREPIRSAVELIQKAAETGVPIVAVDTPTAVDLTSGEASSPAVRADLTVTFHRPKAGLLTRRGAAFAGKVLVAPIGIPLEADRA